MEAYINIWLCSQSVVPSIFLDIIIPYNFAASVEKGSASYLPQTENQA